MLFFFFFNDTATTEIYTLSLHDALPIYHRVAGTALETILGMEGAGSAAYFSCFGKLIANPEKWPFVGRIKRPPTDPVNSLLSFGYSLLTNQVASAVQLVGLDRKSVV